MTVPGDTRARATARWPGLREIRHATPFQRSATAWETPAIVLAPTAVHATPSRAAKVDPGGFGVGTIGQEAPFPCSARLALRPEALTCTPIATHEFDPAHDTQHSWPVGICGLGMGVTDHPGTRALADAAALPRGPSSTAGPAATAARRIRPRTVPPTFSWTQAAMPTRVTVDKPASGTCHPRRALRGKLVSPAPWGPTLACNNASVKGGGGQLCPVMTRPLNLAYMAAACQATPSSDADGGPVPPMGPA
jgi:hypothetical protein